MRLAALTAVAALAAAGTASAGVSVTGVDAVKKANACLMAHGARHTSTGTAGNGSADFGGMVAFYDYQLAKAWPLQNGRVLGVKSIRYDGRLSAARRLVVKRCVYSVL